MAKVSRTQLAKMTARLLRERPAGQRAEMQKVAVYMAASQVAERGESAEALVKDVSRELTETEGTVFAEVRSAYVLTDDTRRELVEFLQKKTGAKTVELDESVDPELLSGVVITTADYTIDLSARQKLKRLASQSMGGNN